MSGHIREKGFLQVIRIELNEEGKPRHKKLDH